MASEYDIRFDGNSSGVFFAGQTLTGSVELNLTKVKKVAGIFVHFKGYCEVSWPKKSGTDNNRPTAHYTGREEYLDITLYLAGAKNGPAFELQPGHHSYPFSCPLPPTLATSIEGQWGHVRYSVKLTLERPWKFDNTHTVSFTVLRHLDLNDNSQDICHPVKVEKNKIFCCFPCSSDPLFMAAEIPIAGYVPGQTVAIKYNVNNQSSRSVYGFTANLIRTDVFKCEQPRIKEKSTETVVASVKYDGIGPREETTFEQLLKIPSCPPTTLVCNLMTVTYAIQLEIGVTGLSFDPTLDFPITIGTIPLANTAVPGYQSATNVSPVATQPMPMMITQPMPFAPPNPDVSSIGPTAPLLPRQFSADLPPPTFEEAMHVNPVNNGKKKEGEAPAVGWLDFNPKYMVYQFDGNSIEAASNSPHPIEFPMPKV
ncbi:arrestin domain-containing protein 3-like isoform X4 [Uranotaenia lowii]|uniref:arrestin domain-containing protein 3-like isoform X4 n=1 Tax=Uranotaenia lowii TaxID=190385 RepID=UPI0024799744|nr:arrestin domain-containing protein 3-like isoform X4 [Uranotaenia lowii]XP_055613062.1 arrestin domain-containing protein 3-like isoform X4 [Uranotaenia lowii]XP_055613063.1 arrestin domain-containing protein 3-like isoform X4 [Uranotaenia lowii]XP_055613064.1 arrestin domain-containing protein 3-like isoform X4 [Uranotaenia lowii]XP_055613065.1 arrestin domain-containing protein 3-like isoform X4 [Uranotaenia lowii]XP_055613066.1 arrestin domain-containing protein 3-like isoform X4 [Uranot